MTDVDNREAAEALFLEKLPLLERLARRVGRRSRFSDDRIEDFLSQLEIKLIENDYEILRGYRGEASVDTFLAVVVTNAFRDYRTHLWGKWRPSAEARRRGPAAVRLEQLRRDGFSDAEAIERLVRNEAVRETREELEALLGALPARTGRSFVGEEAVDAVDVARPVGPDPEDGLRREGSRKAGALLEDALRNLPAEDLLILKMHYRDGVPLSGVARRLGVRQRPLYTRRDRALRRLRGWLEEAGMTWAEVRSSLGWSGSELRADFDLRPGGDPATRSV